MNGCVFKRVLPSGKISWGYSIDAGKDEAGKRIQIFKSGFKRKSEADAALRERLNEKDQGELVRPDPQTFGAYLQEWLKQHAPRKCSPKTLERYGQLAAYVQPHLGTVRLQDLTALALERVFNHLKDAGGRDRKTKTARPLSAKTVHHIAGLVHVALQKAVKLKLLKANPMDGVELPPLEPTEAKALDADQLGWYLDAARAEGIYEILRFSAATGCRRGECLALAWPDVDLVHGAVRIAHSLEQTKAGLRLKSTKGKRSRGITLPGSIIELLRSHRAAQEENRRMFSADYRTDLNLVFCDPQGNYLKPDTVTSKACLIAQKVGLKDVSMHTLRHSHGSQLLSAGVPLPTVSKRLGHANVYTTATIYSHALPKDDLAAAEIWDEKVQKAISPGDSIKAS